MKNQLVATNVGPGMARISIEVRNTVRDQKLNFTLSHSYTIGETIEFETQQWTSAPELQVTTVITSDAVKIPKGSANASFSLAITGDKGGVFYVNEITDPDAWDRDLLLTEAEFEDMGLEVNGDIRSILTAASQFVEIQLARKIKLGDYVFEQLLPDGNTVLLDAWPVQNVASVTVDGNADTGYELVADKGILLLSKHPGKRVTVEYTGGLIEIPMPVKQAVALTALSIDQNNETRGQMLMSERLGDYQEMYYNQNGNSQHSSYATVKLSPAAEALIAPYRGR